MKKATAAISYAGTPVRQSSTPPTDQQIGDFYKANIAGFSRPERRTIRYAVIDDTALKNVPAPTDAEVLKRYQAGAAQYLPAETRSVTQVILPSEDAAKALAADVNGGKAIEAAATAKGLSAAKLTDQTHDQVAANTSKAVADAVFAAPQGKTIAPTRGSLGWVVARVDTITRRQGKTLDQARGEIVTALTAEKRKAALTDLATRIGEKVENGTSLADVAKTYGLQVLTTDPVQADGSQPGKPEAKLPAEVQPLLQSAFAMEHEGQPQIAALPGATPRAAVYDVGRITPAAPAPLAEVKLLVAQAWMMQQGSAAAQAAADKVLAALGKKTPIDAAAKALNVPLPKIDHIAMTREQVAQIQPRVPAPLAKLFTMRPGTAVKIPAPNQGGWLIVSLDTITPGSVAPNDPIVQQAAADLGKATGREYEEQLRTAIAHEIGSKRNETAIRTVNTNLASGSQ